MDFRDFYKKFAETINDPTVEAVLPDNQQGVIESDKKKSLKDWFNQIDNKIVNEADAVTMEPAKQTSQLIKQGNTTIGTVSDPALAASIKDAVSKGKMTFGGDDLKEEQPMMEKAPPGMEDVVLSLKKKYPGEEGKAFAIAWSMYNKKHGKNEAAEDNPESAMLDEKWAGDAKVKATGEYSGKSVEELKSMLAKLKKSGPHKADSPEAKKQHQINFALRAKGNWKKGEGAALKEVDQPTIDNMSARGAGLGAGRNPDVLETKQVNETMNTIEAAYHEGKAHGLTKHGYACRYNEGSDEHKRYHEGFKEGLDECYGLMPNRGLVVSEVDSVPATVPGMADQADKASGLGEMDKTAYMKHKAETTPGDTFKAFGQTFKDKEVLETDAFAFESLDKQLNALLTENETVNEGLSVNMSQGLGGPGGQMDDTVSVTAQGDDAGKLLAFIKQVGLGGLGNDKSEVLSPAEPAVAVVSDYGAPKFDGYDNMKDLLSKVMSRDDYKDEEMHGHEDMTKQICDECGGVMEAGHNHDEKVNEVQTQDQLTDEMAENISTEDISEDDGEGYEQGQEADAQINSALAAGGAAKGGATNEDGMESSPLAADAVMSADAAEQEEEAMSESSFLSLYKKLAWLAEESTNKKDDKAEKAGKKVTKDIEYDEGHKGKDDNKAEKAGKKVTKDIEYDDKKDREEKLSEESTNKKDDKAEKAGKKVAKDIEYDEKVKDKIHGKKRHSEDEKAEKAGNEVKKDIEYDDKKGKKKKVDEWANDAGKDGTEASFERDIEFMTKVIAGGLNKPKSTGQQTIPVLAGDKERTGDEDMAEFKRLAGLGQ